MYSRKIALSLAKQYRRCPPADILKDPSRTAALEKHRRICPYCAADKEKDPPDWDLLVERIQHLRVSTKMDSTDNETPVKAGQLRMVKSPGIWREGWFYNPPMVLVVREALNTPGAVMVAQVYHDPRLAAPGDLILSEGDTAVAPLFVECWNVYSLEASFLGPLLDVVSHQILDAVPGCGEKPDQSPDWAPMPLPMVENDPRAFFRELEVEVAHTFSARSVSQLLVQFEKRSLMRFDFAAEDAREMIRRAEPGTVWKKMPSSPEEVFALASLPVEHLPLAAAGEAPVQKTANLVCLKGTRVLSVSAVPMEMHGQSGDLFLSGRIHRLPVDFLRSHFVCFIETAGDTFPPESCEWKEDSGDFMARFPFSPDDAWEFKAAVVVEMAE